MNERMRRYPGARRPWEGAEGTDRTGPRFPSYATAEEIAACEGCAYPPEWCGSICPGPGKKLPPGKRPEVQEEIRALWAEGCSLVQIQRQTGVDRGSVRGMLIRWGLYRSREETAGAQFRKLQTGQGGNT